MAVSRKKKIIIGTAVILVLAAIIVASVFARRGDLPEVQTAKVERRAALESKVTANGEVRPIQFINLTSEVTGRVTDVFVKEGDQVKKGKPLLRVDPTQLAQSTSIQEAGLRVAQSDVQNQTAVIAAAEMPSTHLAQRSTLLRPITIGRWSNSKMPKSSSSAMPICSKAASLPARFTTRRRCVLTPRPLRPTPPCPASNRRRFR